MADFRVFWAARMIFGIFKNTNNFARLSWPTEALFERFLKFPHSTNMWCDVENYETVSKVPQLAAILITFLVLFVSHADLEQQHNFLAMI